MTGGRSLKSAGVRVLVLVTCLAFIGCGGESKSESKRADSHGHHAHQPKNGGVLVELGDHEFNLELLLEADARQMKAWVLDAHAENYVRLPDKEFEVFAVIGEEERLLTFQAVPNPATGETVGDTAEFLARAGWLEGVKEFEARLGKLTVRGKSFEGLEFHYPTGLEH